MDDGDLTQLVHIAADAVTLEGMLALPRGAPGVVLFAHGSGSSRRSPRNTFVAEVLPEGGAGDVIDGPVKPGGRRLL